MTNSALQQLTQRVEPLAITDTVGRAVELVRRSQLGAAAVVDEGNRVLGLVTEEELLGLLPVDVDGGLAKSLEATRGASLEGLLRTGVTAVPDWYSLDQAARLLESSGAPALPVVEADGGYLGLLSRRGLVDSLGQALRPASVGGMATPLGVYLTTGHHRAGANDVGLVLTGGALFLMTAVAHWLGYLGVFAVDQFTGQGWAEVYLSPFLAATRGLVPLSYGFEALKIAFFFGLFRVVPLTGYHAAEHQVVHTIERGYPFALELVRSMPRPHPRCGTNFAAFLMLFLFLLDSLRTFVPPAMVPVVALAATLPVWRFLGRWLQQYFTTKPASDRQLGNGIAVGQAILAAYHNDPGRRVGPVLRLWHTGLLQVVTGGVAVWGIGRLLGAVIDLSAFL